MKKIFEAKKQRTLQSKDVLAFLESGKIQGTGPAADWIGLFNRIHSFSVIAKKGAVQARNLLIFNTILLVLFALLALPLIAGVSPLFIIPLVIIVVCFFCLLSTWRGLKKLVTPELLDGFVRPLIALLQDDLKSGGMLRCMIDFTAADAPAKLVGTEKVPKKELRRGVTKRVNSTFSNPWFTIEGVLVDRSKIKYEVIDLCRVAKVVKRSQSGKTKFKTKSKIKRIIRIRLRPDTRYTAVPVPPPLGPPSDVAPVLTVNHRPDGSLDLRAQQMRLIQTPGSLASPPAEKVNTVVDLTDRLLALLRPASQASAVPPPLSPPPLSPPSTPTNQEPS